MPFYGILCDKINKGMKMPKQDKTKPKSLTLRESVLDGLERKQKAEHRGSLSDAANAALAVILEKQGYMNNEQA